MTERYPIDVDTLNKGDVISVERLEKITGRSRNHKHFSLEVLKVKDLIRRELRAHQRVLTIVSRKGNLVVCVDAEAATYNHATFGAKLRQAANAHFQNMAVDTTNLDDAQRQAHERAVLTDGRVLQAANKARRDPDFKPRERDTPGLTGRVGSVTR